MYDSILQYKYGKEAIATIHRNRSIKLFMYLGMNFNLLNKPSSKSNQNVLTPKTKSYTSILSALQKSKINTTFWLGI